MPGPIAHTTATKQRLVSLHISLYVLAFEPQLSGYLEKWVSGNFHVCRRGELWQWGKRGLVLSGKTNTCCHHMRDTWYRGEVQCIFIYKFPLTCLVSSQLFSYFYFSNSLFLLSLFSSFFILFLLIFLPILQKWNIIISNIIKFCLFYTKKQQSECYVSP